MNEDVFREIGKELQIRREDLKDVFAAGVGLCG